MIIRRAKHGQTFRERCWFDRGRKPDAPRRYHVFGLCRLVTRWGSAWRLILGPYVILFGYKDNP